MRRTKNGKNGRKTKRRRGVKFLGRINMGGEKKKASQKEGSDQVGVGEKGGRGRRAPAINRTPN